MTTTMSTRPDFRDAAVTASIDALAPHAGVDPMDAGVSYCLPALEDKRSALRGFKIGMILRLVFGIGGLLGGAAMAAGADNDYFADVDDAVILGIGMTLSLGGIGILISAALGQKRFLRKHLGDRYDAIVAIPSPFKPAAAGIEDRATWDKMKLSADDLAIVVFDVEGRRIVMEGLSHSYVIHAADVLSLRSITANSGQAIGLEIIYQCGRLPLTLVLTQENILHEVRRQTIGSATSPLYKKAVRALAK